jgi:hypothetical protein
MFADHLTNRYSGFYFFRLSLAYNAYKYIKVVRDAPKNIKSKRSQTSGHVIGPFSVGGYVGKSPSILTKRTNIINEPR